MKSIPMLIVAFFLLFEVFRFIKYYRVTNELQKTRLLSIVVLLVFISVIAYFDFY
jgi:MFS superfamily sulfate permease-like transporter